LTQEATAAPTKKPLLPFIKVTEKFPEEPAYVWGSKCKSCGAQFLGERTACGKCGATDGFEEVRFSDEGEIYVFSVVHQSAPGIETPYVGAIVDLKDGPSVRANVIGLDPENPSVDWFGKKVKMVAEKVATDRDGNEVIAAKYQVV
jgi:uncharacterized OB-fold protein